ncbi:MAG: protein-glutamate O-methyltransferase CheR [Desulfobacterales bacterium]|nr:protein-glutamate O-methyltransferase CheR [Desulfobacterales bacterium]
MQTGIRRSEYENRKSGSGFKFQVSGSKMATLMSAELTEKQFKKVSQIIYRLCGICLKEGKEALVRARLMKRLRALGLENFDAYLKFIESDKGVQELSFMVDAITTNKTSFFREPAHFDFLRDQILPELSNRRLRFWTAACSSGEEPYSLAILLKENITDIDTRDVKILATDISTRMLDKARNAVYDEGTLHGIPNHMMNKYFTRIQNESYRVKENVRTIVRVARLNLMDTWPMKGPFNVIFCRNVMIYFDRPTQQKLISRFWNFLEHGGYLFVGHSEGLSAISHKFNYVRPAIYRK